jgi:hypothetical protein
MHLGLSAGDFAVLLAITSVSNVLVIISQVLRIRHDAVAWVYGADRPAPPEPVVADSIGSRGCEADLRRIIELQHTLDFWRLLCLALAVLFLLLCAGVLFAYRLLFCCCSRAPPQERAVEAAARPGKGRPRGTIVQAIADQ